MIIKILNNTTPYGKIMASHEGSLHSSTLKRKVHFIKSQYAEHEKQTCVQRCTITVRC